MVLDYGFNLLYFSESLKLDRWIRKNEHSPTEKRPRVSSLSCFIEETNLGETLNSSEERNIWMVSKCIFK